MTFRQALITFLAWVGLALLFNVGLWWYFHSQSDLIAHTKALEFFTGYLLELTLSADNMFVFLIIFQYFKIPETSQRRVLLWGLIGAVILRFILILAGVWAINALDWLLYVLGALLIFMGFKMWINRDQPTDYSQSKLLGFLRKHLRITEQLQEEKFFIAHKGFLYATPLFLALIWIELSDVIFALDSIPAIFSVTTDPLIVYTSNIFAIVALRSLYFLFAKMTDRFSGLQNGVILILIFIGIKMLLGHWVHLPIWLTLGTIVLILGGSLVWGGKKNEN